MRKTSAAPVVQMTKMYSPAAMPVHKWSWKSVRRITACVPSRRIVRGFLSDWPTDRDPESTRPHLQERSQRTLTGPWPACYNRIHGSVVHARVLLSVPFRHPPRSVCDDGGNLAFPHRIHSRFQGPGRVILSRPFLLLGAVAKR